jgi:hypothetical protein
MPREISQKEKYFMIVHIHEEPKIRKFIETESRFEVGRG